MPSSLYGFAYSDSALAYLKTIQIKFRKQIVAKIEMLAENPYPNGCKKLHNVMDGDYPVHRVRSGDYRILYSVRNNPDQIVVLDIGDRKDVYR
jgi:mRNA interferase RelE/StbE